MALAQAAESRHALRAVSLLGVLVAAKAITLMLFPSSVTWSVWAPIAFFWQDALVALVAYVIFFFIDVVLKRPLLAWILYASVAVYVAVNVPITIVLSSPLTLTLMRAAGGALTDSITHYLTATNIVGLSVPLVVACVLPWLLSQRTQPFGLMSLAGLVALAALGPFALARTETHGLHRNAIGALVETSLPRLARASPSTSLRAEAEDWRESPFASAAGEDLSRLRASLQGRNVVLIILESTAARYLSIYGAREDPMPNLTQLARGGIVFDRAYSVYPESIKGLFATLCSTYPAFDTDPEIYAHSRASGEPGVPCASLAAALKDAGYRTGLFHSGRFDYLGMKAVIENRGFDVLEDAGAIGGQVHSSFGVDEASTVKRVLQWIDSTDSSTSLRASPSRFFVTYQPIAGHHPYPTTEPGPFTGSTDFVQYLNALHEGDAALGDLVRGLETRGLASNTLFVIFGDHGEAFGQHPGNFAHTLFIYEENVRVPLVIAAPGAGWPGARVSRIASVVDIAPTILDLLGVSLPGGYQGSSLLDPASRLALFYTDYSLGWLGLADGCWKYVFEIESRRSRLFDVCADPDESRERAAQFPERVRVYRERVERWAPAQRERIIGRR